MALNRSLLSVFNRFRDYAPVASPFPKFPHNVWGESSFAYKATESSKQWKKVIGRRISPTVSVELKKPLDSAAKKHGDLAPDDRESANLQTSVWGDSFFLTYETMEPFPGEQKKEMKQLRQEIIMMLKETPDASPLKLHLIDNVQRLGLSYQFEDEIESSLYNIYQSYHQETQNDLHTVALRFRLLRHQGFHVTSGIRAEKFQNQEGEFEVSLASDVQRLLSLHEASHYSVHGENILDEALTFTTATLQHMGDNFTGLMANRIHDALTWPIRKTLDRVTARKYISLYQKDEAHDKVLLKFAKSDFNRVQRMHQQELCALTKWWEGIDVARNYPFVRDKLVENYFVIAGVYFEPKYCLARKIQNMVVDIFTIIDDFYDAYGTIDELLLLTHALERFDTGATCQLPPYMMPCYGFILKSFAEMEEELAKNGKGERRQYVKVELKKFAQASYQDSYWNHIGYIPSYEEHMEKGIIFNGIQMMMTTSYVGMGDLVTKTVLDWALSEPPAIQAAATIVKLTDDIHDHEHTVHPTSVECYMNQFGVTKEEAIEELQKKLSHAWKDLNNECLLPIPVPTAIMERPLNVARMIVTLFKYGDGYTFVDSNSKKLIRSVLVDPII